jgi:hypothetical protein
MFRRFVAGVSSVLLVGSVWAGSIPVGSVDVSQGARISGAATAAGASVFAGDTISVPAGGSLAVVLRGGSRVVMSANSETRLLRQGAGIALAVSRGGAELSVPANASLEGLLDDVSFRPASPNKDSVGWIGFIAPNRPVLYAEKGDWIATTAGNGRSLTLHPGERLNGVVSESTQQEPNQGHKRKKAAVIWIGSALIGTTTALALAFGMSECTINGTGQGCGQQPVASPIAP